jgi:hypothetical protein
MKTIKQLKKILDDENRKNGWEKATTKINDIKQCIAYLETNPREDFTKDIALVDERRWDFIETNKNYLVSQGYTSPKEMESYYNSKYNLSHLKKQQKMLEMILS